MKFTKENSIMYELYIHQIFLKYSIELTELKLTQCLIYSNRFKDVANYFLISFIFIINSFINTFVLGTKKFFKSKNTSLIRRHTVINCSKLY